MELIDLIDGAVAMATVSRIVHVGTQCYCAIVNNGGDRKCVVVPRWPAGELRRDHEISLNLVGGLATIFTRWSCKSLLEGCKLVKGFQR